MICNIDTIAAPATPPGRGGVAIIRVSGPQVKNIISQILNCELIPRQATYLPFRDASNDIIDEGIAVFFPNPNSYTGEDVLELQGHGGPVIVDLLLQRILSLGVRLARPGEFSERAFLNGKLDLTQAEAIADLIDASSAHAARCAVRSLQGVFSQQIYALNEKVIHLRTYIEAMIDFTDEEINFLSQDKLQRNLKSIIKDLDDIRAQAKQGNLLREGITVVIAGEPNVGKSSLLNCLSGKELAIVTDIPGTTRDVLRDHILIDGMPIHIIDTAGLRETEDVVEQEGVRRAYKEIEQADIVLYVMEAHKPIESKSQVLENFATQTIVFIHNKIDLLNTVATKQVEQGQTNIYLSAQTGEGIGLLKDHIKLSVGFRGETGYFLARRRHVNALLHASSHLQNSLVQLATRTLELAAEDLRLAQNSLSEITGEFSSDDLLGKIFSSFCIGK